MYNKKKKKQKKLIMTHRSVMSGWKMRLLPYHKNVLKTNCYQMVVLRAASKPKNEPETGRRWLEVNPDPNRKCYRLRIDLIKSWRTWEVAQELLTWLKVCIMIVLYKKKIHRPQIFWVPKKSRRLNKGKKNWKISRRRRGQGTRP